MVMLKLILDFQTYYYKIFDGPYYNSYLNKHISVCRKFYKALYKQDSEEVQGDEWKLSKTIKKSIIKALTRSDLGRKKIKEIKQLTFIDKKSKNMVKFYKKESEAYKELLMDLNQEAFYA